MLPNSCYNSCQITLNENLPMASVKNRCAKNLATFLNFPVSNLKRNIFIKKLRSFLNIYLSRYLLSNGRTSLFFINDIDPMLKVTLRAYQEILHKKNVLCV